jgi:hypothetical protein
MMLSPPGLSLFFSETCFLIFDVMPGMEKKTFDDAFAEMTVRSRPRKP